MELLQKVMALHHGIAFLDHVCLRIPVHCAANRVLRSVEKDGLVVGWETLSNTKFDGGYVFVKLDHFCDIIPVWPADQGSVPVGLAPFWHPRERQIVTHCHMAISTCWYKSCSVVHR